MGIEEILVLAASFVAGLIDAVVGGGGLVLLPALFATFPGAAPATLIGTNKTASVWGTSVATWRYARRVNLNWRVLLIAAGVAFVGSLLGAYALTLINPDVLRKALPFILLVVLIYVLANKNMGYDHAPRFTGRHELLFACAIGIVLGVYDGLFGPGTGSFLIFLLVRVLGYDFLHASASAKVLNVATNLAAILLLSLKGHVWWQLGLTMAAFNVAGSVVGAHLALKHGSGFVRFAFVVVVSALIAKTAWDAFA